MPGNSGDYTSKPNSWFATEIAYEGLGRAEFVKPSGFVTGHAKANFDESGKASIEMEIEYFECEEYLETQYPDEDILAWMLSGRKPNHIGSVTFYVDGINPKNTCKSLVITMDDEVFSAHGKILYSSPSLGWGNIVFDVISSEYRHKTDQKARYWVMPLINFVSDVLKTIPFPGHRHILDQHPLRVIPPLPVPSDLHPKEQTEAIVRANLVNCFIPFQFDQKLGFIERLADYHEREKRLQQGKANLLTTSLMVGECENRPIELDKALKWLPFEYLHMLSLASGSHIGTPWIEFRSDSGELTHRLDTRQWQAPFSKGYIAIDQFSAGGIGWLLSNAPQNLGPELRTAISFVVKGGQSVYYGEDRLAFLFRAADALTKDLRTTNSSVTRVKIDEDRKMRIKASIKTARQEIAAVADETSGNEETEIRRIAQVVSGAMNPKKPDSAKALALLAKTLNLNDFSVVPEVEKWMQLYNKYRNQVIHEGYIPEDMFQREAHSLCLHLHDLLIRIILKKLGYDGEYRKTVRRVVNRSVDWVTPETSFTEIWVESHED